MNWHELEQRYGSGVYAQRDIPLIRGEGVRVWDAHGREYIDCVGGHGVAVLGHNHPAVVEAVHRQMQRLTICPPSFPNDVRARCMERLGTLVPGLNRVFLCNSGTEAVEGAIKFARYSTGRPKIVAAKRGFHGRTLGALSATWNRKYREPFEPLVPEFVHGTFNKLETFEALVDDRTAAVIVEVVQGEGGVHPATTAFLQGLQALVRERGALLIIDEVQTGMGRTGRLFAFQHHGIEPDIVALAKGIAGGFPMGAVLLGERVKPGVPGIHGSTFGGNPVAAAACLATLEVLERESLPQRAARLGAWFLERLRAIRHPLIRDVRGLGLMVGVELRTKVAPFLQALAQEGVLALPAGLTVIRFLPPLTITQEDLEAVAQALERALAQVSGQVSP